MNDILFFLVKGDKVKSEDTAGNYIRSRSEVKTKSAVDSSTRRLIRRRERPKEENGNTDNERNYRGIA